MKRITLIASIALTAGTIAGAAFAAHGRTVRATPERPAISSETMRQKINALGYDVRRLRQHGSVFKTALVERQSGGVIRARFDGAGELVRASPVN